MTKPLPAKGYCRAIFLIEQSAYDPKVRWVRLHSRPWISAYIADGEVVFSPWLRRNTSHLQRGRVVEALWSGRLGDLEVELWPAAFPRIYGLLEKKDRAAA